MSRAESLPSTYAVLGAETRASDRSIPLIAACVAFLLHLVGNPHYGFFLDELYFIACGLRPDWGYVDQPPLAPLLAAGSQLAGHSLVLLRAVPALFSAASVAVTCLLVVELGGGRFAQGLAALFAFLCPVLMNFGMKVSTDMPGLVLWPLIALLVLQTVKNDRPRLLAFAGIAIGVALQAKHSAVFLAVALAIGLLVSPHRRWLRSPWFFAGAGLAGAIAFSNFLWQWSHGFPMLELLNNGQNGKNVILSPAGFLSAQLLITNPFLAPAWIVGLLWLFRKPEFRFLAWAFVVLMAEMIVFHGKHYYSANIYPILFAAGGVAIETWTQRIQKLRGAVVAATLVSGAVFVPYMLPIFPVETFIAYNGLIKRAFNFENTKTEIRPDGVLPQDFAGMHGWPELAAAVSQVYQTLSEEERSQAVIYARTYGQAAALEFFGAEFGLPPVISGHNQFFLWGLSGLGDRKGEVLIEIGGDCGESSQLYRTSEVAETFSHPYVMPYDDQLPIRVCRGLNRPLEEVWTTVKRYR